MSVAGRSPVWIISQPHLALHRRIAPLRRRISFPWARSRRRSRRGGRWPAATTQHRGRLSASRSFGRLEVRSIILRSNCSESGLRYCTFDPTPGIEVFLSVARPGRDLAEPRDEGGRDGARGGHRVQLSAGEGPFSHWPPAEPGLELEPRCKYAAPGCGFRIGLDKPHVWERLSKEERDKLQPPDDAAPLEDSGWARKGCSISRRVGGLSARPVGPFAADAVRPIAVLDLHGRAVRRRVHSSEPRDAVPRLVRSWLLRADRRAQSRRGRRRGPGPSQRHPESPSLVRRSAIMAWPTSSPINPPTAAAAPWDSTPSGCRGSCKSTSSRT